MIRADHRAREALGLALVLLFVAAIIGCAGPGLDRVRYANADPIWVVNDRQNIPEPPAARRFVRLLYHFDGFYHRRLTRLTEVRPTRRAANVNAYGEVPDSTWFTNRIGRHELSVEQVRRGPNREPGPMANKPWTVAGTKSGGASPGLVISDAAGERYLLKFDRRGFPEMETAADVIVARLLHAIGFNVPENYVVKFRRSDLRGGGAGLSEQLAGVEVGPDGSIRALASRMIPGRPVGGWAGEGVRAADPNDRVPHELRRDLRGAYAVFAWLDHVDIKEDNTLDVWTEDRADPAIHYLAHYYVDFGLSLGVQEAVERLRHLGHTHIVDLSASARALVTFGLYKRRWETRELSGLRGVGLIGVEDFDPGGWKPRVPGYFPLELADRFDNYWAAKIIMRFTEAQLRAVVAEAQLADPRAARALTRALVGRQRKTGKHWFSRVNPLDNFAIDGDRLCFDDLMATYRLDRIAASYRARAFDRAGRSTGWSTEARASSSGRACVAGIAPSSSRDGYTIIELTTSRPGRKRLPPTLVHLARRPERGSLRIIGVRRL